MIYVVLFWAGFFFGLTAFAVFNDVKHNDNADRK